MQRVIALKPHQYRSQERIKGEIYECEDIHVDLLKIMGNAIPAPPEESEKPKPEKAGRYKKRDMRVN